MTLTTIINFEENNLSGKDAVLPWGPTLIFQTTSCQP